MTVFINALMLTILVSLAMAAPIGEFCSPLHGGKGPSPVKDTPESFQALKALRDAATSAITPSGYIQSYVNMNTTYNQPQLFAGYTDLEDYDVQSCANSCDVKTSCNAFTIFFERSPTILPGPACPNPASTTRIKCVLWTGTINLDMPMNHGQYRQGFHVVIAGSNAYVKDVLDTDVVPSISGYTTDVYKNGAGIQAPLDCNGKDTYLGVQKWYDGKFSAHRCLDACDTTKDCHFVNTYFLRKNGVPFAQHCALFSAHWPEQYATNEGQYGGEDEFHMNTTYSYGFTRNDGQNHEACKPVTSLPLLS